MIAIWFLLLCVFSVIACGLVSGVFLAFSGFVMRSLSKAKASAGIEVMQIINREVWPTLFIALLLGMSALSPGLMAYAYFQIEGTASTLIITGGAIYLLGSFVVSLAFNVPMNNRLDSRECASAEVAIYWTNTYVPRWTFWNYIRAASSGSAAVCYLFASILMAQNTFHIV